MTDFNENKLKFKSTFAANFPLTVALMSQLWYCINKQIQIGHMWEINGILASVIHQQDIFFPKGKYKVL